MKEVTLLYIHERLKEIVSLANDCSSVISEEDAKQFNETTKKISISAIAYSLAKLEKEVEYYGKN